MGKYYEEFNVGDVFKHRLTRTITETDNLLFTTLTHNPQPLHLDEEFSKSTIYGERVVNSLFTLSLLVGVSVEGLTNGTTLGNLGFNETIFPNPVKIGDTLRFETTIIHKRISKSRPNTGIVTFKHSGFNQKDELVAETKRAGLILRQNQTGK